MAGIYSIGGDFLADGTVRAFTTVRNKPTGGSDCALELTYSEMFNPGSSSIVAANANSLWKIGLRRTSTSATYWATKGGWNIWSFGAIPAGDYVVVCQAYSNQTKPPLVTPRIRFSGILTLR